MAERTRVAETVPLGFVVRPVVALATPWIYVCATWFIGILITAKHTVPGSAEHAAEGDIAGLLSSPGLVVVSAVNVLLLLALCADGRVAWGLPPCMRRSQLAGVLLCAVNIALLQWGAVLAYDPFFWT